MDSTGAAAVVEFTDEGFRDGPQSLWGSRMTTSTMVDIARRVDDVGYQKSVVISGATFEAAVQHLHEDPWARLDRVTTLMKNTPAAAQIRGRTLFGWQQFPDDVVRLFIKTLAKHGIKWLLVYEALNDMKMVEEHVAAARDEGLQVTIPICYSVSPVHTIDYFLEVFREAVAMNPESVSILDASGLLSPEEARHVAAAVKQLLHGTDVQLEMNVHDLTGRGMECYRAGLESGVEIFATAPRSVAYGKGLPSVGDLVAAAAAVGSRSPLDATALRDVESYFTWAAYLQGEPVPVSMPLDPGEIVEFTKHQVPGGMMSNLIRQLTDLGIVDKLPEILDEVQAVRADLGFPVMVTPCSQMVGVQATLNVMSGQRYANSPVEVKNYLRGIYGTPPGKVDANVIDRVLGGAPPTDPYARLKEPMLPGFRAKHGPFRSDEELLLSVMYSEKALENYRRRREEAEVGPKGPQAALLTAIIERFHPSSIRARL